MINLRLESRQQNIQFHTRCLESITEWDKYLRSLTPDLPHMLSDYASSIAVSAKFEIIWEYVHEHFTASERQQLLGWIHSAAQISGAHIRLLPG